MPGAAAAPVITCGEPGSFSRSVFTERHPQLVSRLHQALPYGPDQHRALDMLLDESLHGVIQPLGEAAHDRDQWHVWGRDHYGTPWLEAPFLWAESYFYRRLLEAVGYFAPGPWQGVDPFRPMKTAELHTPETAGELSALDSLATRPADDQAQALLQGSLWGNRADLGFRMTAAASGDTPASPLVADDSGLLWSLLPAGGDAELCLVADNAGRELLADLALTDHLLRHRHARRVVLQVKPHPYYVSDATTADVVDCLRHVVQSPGAAAETGRRLWTAMGDGRLTVRTHPFHCAPLPYRDMPDDLRREFGRATLTVLKGDLNYRRLVGDRMWPPTTPFADRTGWFPGPVAALRTLKSDVVVGLAPGAEAALSSAHGPRWRTEGTHALIQARR
ncbi:damage-control phosphatase ARMT1 family protein [Streptacidiphilus griseoplanus]|uniref:damage-control phosphatase ARMT1 family protein n=1 Tax=Peterkaempfera griseoplana TaxID=66896 RepID=UPI0006E1EBC9|nr:damage-control phosphatase ARMT1 family protein [Peterkaempfera griseoplana]